ncbi:MAG TPA: hypothetical protein DEA71_13515 [Nitrospira sp.]|nr:hypothetical protein [Nitrospira sp.]
MYKRSASNRAYHPFTRAMVDDVVFQCPGLTWNQIFLAIDRLSREGTLTLTPKGGGLYAVQVSDQATLTTQPM